MTALSPTERIFVALDTTDLTRAAGLVEVLAGKVGGFKIGKEFFTANGPDGVGAVLRGEPLFLDLKWHDIPNTVAGAVRAAMAMHPRIINVHAAGGPAMMAAAAEACREAAEDHAVERPLLLAVTVLTSLDEHDLGAVGQIGPVPAQVVRLAKLAQEQGCDGVVCSPQEIGLLREEIGPDFKLLTPGIRPSWAAAGDQKRIMTPSEAVHCGADFLVIGRPITAAANPAEAAEKIAEELAAA